MHSNIIKTAWREAQQKDRCLAYALKQLQKQNHNSQEQFDNFVKTIIDNPYIPHIPTEKQTDFLLSGELEIFYGGAASGGKQLKLDTLIPTVDGWKTMGEMTVGDKVFSSDGTPTEVIAVSEIDYNADSYEVEFDTGDIIVADARHLWLTKTYKERATGHKRTDEYRDKRRKSRPSRAVKESKKPWVSKSITRINKEREYEYLQPSNGNLRTTSQIKDTLNDSGRNNHSITMAKPINTEEKNLPIDPYVLGLWLGDGWSNSGVIGMADDDWEAVLQYCNEPIYHHNRDADKRRKTPYTTVRFDGLTTTLRKVGLYNNKHIPIAYLRASVGQRIELLKGLMDSDGTCDKDGHCGITLTNKTLMEGTHELVSSLGIKAIIIERDVKLNGRYISKGYVMSFVSPFKVFNLSRMAARQRLDKKRTVTNERYIVDVRQTDKVPMRCVQVEHESGMYLVGKSFIPTHNSEALLMAALQYVHEPGYAAILLRQSYADLLLPEALMDRAAQWLRPTDAVYQGHRKAWVFPSGASISFGYLEATGDEYRYQSAAFQYIGFDELTQFTESQYTYLFSRLRRLEGSTIPMRMRSASNPGNIGHAWCKRRFITPNEYEMSAENRRFIPAFMEDNPFVDLVEYEEALSRLDGVTRAQLRRGNWDVSVTGGLFKRESFGIVHVSPQCPRWIRAWDLAATEAKKGKDPDYSVGLKIGMQQGVYYIDSVIRFRKNPGDTERIVLQTAQLDGPGVEIVMEQEGGSSGKNSIHNFATKVLVGYSFRGIPSTGSKVERARIASAAAHNGNIKIVGGQWSEDFINELVAFPNGEHDDQVDALSLSMSQLNTGGNSDRFGAVSTSRGWQG